jgi:hypothetical protein
MFKYGAAVHSPEFDRLQAARWWLDFLIAPASARNRRVMYLYSVSDLDGKNLTALIEKIARQQGRETPMVGFVATPGALKNLGNDIEDGDQSKYIIVPIWWNKRVATSLRGIARMLSTGLTQARDSFSAVVTALVAKGHAYSADFENCHPPRGSVLALSNKPVLLRALHDDVFFASNQPIDIIKGEPRKIIAHERHWPTLDE